jgi:DHA1 family multidrug resistance protein-like MFS transporter
VPSPISTDARCCCVSASWRSDCRRFIYPFISDLNALTALRFVHGLATAIFAPSALATVADLYKERRGAALGTYTACTQSGSLLGPFLGGWLAYTAGFSTAFVTAGVFGCIAILIFFSLHLDEPPPRVRERAWHRSWLRWGRAFSPLRVIERC